MKWFSRWEVLALASAFFAGLTAFLGKMGVMNVNSNLATFIRTVVVLVMTACIISWRHQWQWPQGAAGKAWIFLTLSGVATGLSWLCYYRALGLGPVSKVAPIDKLSVAFAVILGILFLGEKLSWQVALGAGLIILGAMVIVFL
ncbi:MAG: EamA family transporter [Candidatus Omnitrophica bacterium]|nr:EamA family transporter [Candidatus Omnitrophota bacterium]